MMHNIYENISNNYTVMNIDDCIKILNIKYRDDILIIDILSKILSSLYPFKFNNIITKDMIDDFNKTIKYFTYIGYLKYFIIDYNILSSYINKYKKLINSAKPGSKNSLKGKTFEIINTINNVKREIDYKDIKKYIDSKINMIKLMDSNDIDLNAMKEDIKNYYNKINNYYNDIKYMYDKNNIFIENTNDFEDFGDFEISQAINDNFEHIKNTEIIVSEYYNKLIEKINIYDETVSSLYNDYTNQVNNYKKMIEDVNEVYESELNNNIEYDFEFKNVEKPYESYYGMNVKLRYFLKFALDILLK